MGESWDLRRGSLIFSIAPLPCPLLRSQHIHIHFIGILLSMFGTDLDYKVLPQIY